MAIAICDEDETARMSGPFHSGPFHSCNRTTVLPNLKVCHDHAGFRHESPGAFLPLVLVPFHRMVPVKPGVLP